MPATTPNLGLQYPLLGDAADIEGAVKPMALQLDAYRLNRRIVALAAQQVLEVGQVGQIRAGRQLAPADFTNMGLSAPLGLWNLGTISDSSGNARDLTNKGTVPFTTGINGAATTAAQFAGSTAQALYIASAAWQQIKTGSFGCWFRTAKRGVVQTALAKWSATAGQGMFTLGASAANVAVVNLSFDGTGVFPFTATSDVADDRWHFVVATTDGTRARVYVDGILEAQGAFAASPFASSGPLNVGAQQADGATAATNSFYGRVDEAFITADVLSPEQVLNLYCARVTHALLDGASAPLAPTSCVVSVRRRKRGGAIVSGDFPSAPVRLHAFTAGALTDAGSGGVALTANPGTGAIVDVADADGSAGGAKSFSGAHTGLSATDTGLPGTTTARSFGCWFKTGTLQSGGLIAWGGTINSADTRIAIGAGALTANNGADGITGPNVIDGLWHHAVAVEDNSAGDGVKRKLYLDGRLVGGSTVLNSVTLTGANRFRVGAMQDATFPFTGQIDDAFVFAGALTPDQVRTLYNKGSQSLLASPKSEGDHVESMETTSVLARFDTLEGCDLVNLEVSA